MIRSLTVALLSTVVLATCIENAPTNMDPPDDAQVADADRGQDAEIRQDAQPVVDAEPPADIGRFEPICADNGDAARCEAASCAWRQSCVDPTPCTQIDVSRCVQLQCIVTADERCVDPSDPSRCDDTATPAQCEARQCVWRRGQGDAQARCWSNPAPTVQDCAQPDPATCEAAGCEWTGQGCAPPNQTPCAQLDDAACGVRVECILNATGCMIDPDAPCARLATDDCSTRPDCGMRGLACVDLPQEPCRRTPQWVCEQRHDCEARYPDCDDAPKGGAGGGGGQGGGGPVACEVREDCHESQGCEAGLCVACTTYLRCADR